jgi:hypothetical protein
LLELVTLRCFLLPVLLTSMDLKTIHDLREYSSASLPPLNGPESNAIDLSELSHTIACRLESLPENSHAECQ